MKERRKTYIPALPPPACPDDDEPLPTPDNATVKNAPKSPYWLWDEFLYTCPDGYVSPLSSSNATQRCGEDGWSISEEAFGCYKGETELFSRDRRDSKSY